MDECETQAPNIKSMCLFLQHPHKSGVRATCQGDELRRPMASTEKRVDPLQECTLQQKAYGEALGQIKPGKRTAAQTNMYIGVSRC
eukprot:1149219-Pelagomonas_calceolata.AAC.3